MSHKGYHNQPYKRLLHKKNIHNAKQSVRARRDRVAIAITSRRLTAVTKS